ncbi:MAG TPA: helix-turn-helix transcriptional regulator [Actinomycetota bacterium]|nr:helix-turn-helix transcriptional regulator [Actinomycetota bacterium]
MSAMHGGELIREARKRAGLTQQALAELLATTQPAVARWENGKTSPSFERVVEAIRACGFDLGVRIVAFDDQHALLVQDNLRRTPAGRLDRLTQSHASLADLVASAKVRDHAV